MRNQKEPAEGIPRLGRSMEIRVRHSDSSVVGFDERLTLEKNESANWNERAS